MNKEFYEIPFDEILAQLTPDYQKYLALETKYILSRCVPSDTVLEVGCGSGRLLEILAHKVKRIVGVDNSSIQITRARERTSHLPKIEIYQQDGKALEFHDNYFDVSCMTFNTLGSFGNDKTKALEQLCRVTKRTVLVGVYSEDATPYQLEFYRKVGFGEVTKIDENITSVRNVNGITITSEKFTLSKINLLLQELGVSADICKISNFSYMIDIKIKNQQLLHGRIHRTS